MKGTAMRLTLLLIFTLCFGAVAPAQTQDLPEYGDIASIKSMSKVYVGAEDSDARNRIIKELSKYKTLEVVGSPSDAEFFIEYGMLDKESLAMSQVRKERKMRAQMRVYTLAPDSRRIIVWSDTHTRETEDMMGLKMYDSGRSENELTKKFINALKKARGEK